MFVRKRQLAAVAGQLVALFVIPCSAEPAPSPALLLGSWWGLAAGGVMVVGVARRAVLEERVLRSELDGYAEYMTRVRHRFVPGIW